MSPSRLCWMETSLRSFHSFLFSPQLDPTLGRAAVSTKHPSQTAPRNRAAQRAVIVRSTPQTPAIHEKACSQRNAGGGPLTCSSRSSSVSWPTPVKNGDSLLKVSRTKPTCSNILPWGIVQVFRSLNTVTSETLIRPD